MSGLDQVFLTKLLLSFLVGSVWVTSVTVIAERFGSKIGGFIGGLPSTIVVALLFIGLSQDADSASRAAVMIPLVMGVNGIFIIIYLLMVRHGLAISLASALLFWFILNGGIILEGIESLPVSIIGWFVSLMAVYFIAEHGMDIQSKGGIRVPYTMQQILARGLVSGFTISLAVLVSRVAGPVVGGIFSTFPVIFISTLAITYHTGGPEFSRAVAKTLMLSGLINVAAYAITALFAIAWLGVWGGSGISMLASLFSGYLTYRIIRRLVS